MTITVPNLRTLSMRNGGVFPADAVTAYIDGREQRAAHGSRRCRSGATSSKARTRQKRHVRACAHRGARRVY